MNRSYLAMDFGGSSGRGILGTYDGHQIHMEELIRFPDYFVEINDICYWDTFMMLKKIEEAMESAERKTAEQGGDLVSIGIDAWGTDYGLLDKEGNPLGTAICERNTKGIGRKTVTKLIGKEELYNRTGTHSLNGNTLFQLYERKQREDSQLFHASLFLMLPDLLGYFLTGVKKTEYSDAATTMILDTEKQKWNTEFLEVLGLPKDLCPAIVRAGTERWPLLPGWQRKTRKEKLFYVPVLTHDTASAVSVIPYRENQAFASSGTWTIMGMTGKKQIRNRQAMKYNFASSELVNGLYKIHRDFMGMWMISGCRNEWIKQGNTLTWDDITAAAKEAEPFSIIIDVDEPDFFNSGNMLEKLERFCEKTGQKLPDSVGGLSRCVYEGIVLRYMRTMEELTEITGETITSLRIIGGGSNNRFLNQLLADALEMPVTAGPSEAASIGNVMMQMYADGAIESLEEGYEIVERSFPSETFVPETSYGWKEFYQKYKVLTGQK